jgi:ribosomal RNA-processing protein 36
VGAQVVRRSRKDAPREVSSRRPVPCGRARCLGIEAATGGGGGGGRRFDPRFEEHCGELDEVGFGRRFGFLDALREKEREEMRRAVARGDGGPDACELLRKAEAEEARRREAARREAIRVELKAEEREKVRNGKKPWFFKESDVRERELRLKFGDLKKVGGVQKYIEKRRKRSAAKDRKHLPERRPEPGGGGGGTGWRERRPAGDE